MSCARQQSSTSETETQRLTHGVFVVKTEMELAEVQILQLAGKSSEERIKSVCARLTNWMNVGPKNTGELPVLPLLRAWLAYVLTVTYIAPKLKVLSNDHTEPWQASKQNALISHSWQSRYSTMQGTWFPEICTQ